MSDDSQQLVDEISTSTIQPVDEIQQWVVEIGSRYNRDTSHATRPPMDSNIEKIPSIVGNWQCWDDFGVSFIPETLKWQFVAFIPHWFGLNIRSYLEYMQEKVDVAWSYYQGVDKQFRVENSKGFIEHLLVNSCYLIFGMVLLSDDDNLKHILNKIIDESNLPNGLTYGDITNIKQFLLRDKLQTQSYAMTLEYQIPWFVVEAVYTKFSNIGKLLDIPIHKLALLSFAITTVHDRSTAHRSNEDVIFPEGGFKHLLHIFHWYLTTEGKYRVDTSRPARWVSTFYIPSATELQLSQIDFVKDESVSHNVSYCDGKLFPMMKLTPCYFHEFTTKLNTNFIKFERCYGRWCGYHFMAYVACMACLIKTEADIKLFRANGLIQITSVNDMNVLRYVQELRTLIPDNFNIPTELVILEKEVMEHYQRSRYRVIGEFKKQYCSNPWIIISVIAGILLFALTFIQTLYGTLSYYKQ